MYICSDIVLRMLSDGQYVINNAADSLSSCPIFKSGMVNMVSAVSTVANSVAVNLPPLAPQYQSGGTEDQVLTDGGPVSQIYMSHMTIRRFSSKVTQLPFIQTEVASFSRKSDELLCIYHYIKTAIYGGTEDQVLTDGGPVSQIRLL